MLRRFRLGIGAFVALIVAVVVGVTAVPAHAAAWSSSDRWGNWSNGGYTVYNNVWGSGAGPQSIWANSYSNWGVWANHPNTGGIKSYPNSTKWVGKKVSALGTTTSSFNVSVPTSGVAFTSAYDIWSSDNQHEIMLWMNKYGAVGPLGSLPDERDRRRSLLEHLQGAQRWQQRVLLRAHEQHQLGHRGRSRNHALGQGPRLVR